MAREIDFFFEELHAMNSFNFVFDEDLHLIILLKVFSLKLCQSKIRYVLFNNFDRSVGTDNSVFHFIELLP